MTLIPSFREAEAGRWILGQPYRESSTTARTTQRTPTQKRDKERKKKRMKEKKNSIKKTDELEESCVNKTKYR